MLPSDFISLLKSIATEPQDTHTAPVQRGFDFKPELVQQQPEEEILCQIPAHTTACQVAIVNHNASTNVLASNDKL